MQGEPREHVVPEELHAKALARIVASRDARGAATQHRGHLPSSERRALDDVRREVRAALRHAGAGGPDGEGVRLLADVDAERYAAADEEQDRRVDVLARMHRAMQELRELPASQDVLAAVPEKLVSACGFSRAMVSHVRGRAWSPIALTAAAELPSDQRLDALQAQAPFELSHGSLEAEVVRRRESFSSLAAPRESRMSDVLVTSAGAIEYVVAPVVVGDRVVGLLHADRLGQGQALTDADRELLATFAEHLELLYERAVLLERLEAQRAGLRDALGRAQAEIDDLCTADIALVRDEQPQDVPVRDEEREARTSIATLLSPRELEVLEAMATGAANHEIAEQLVITTGTVKSHVKRILRKLRVASRSEAVARYMHFVLRERDRERERARR